MSKKTKSDIKIVIQGIKQFARMLTLTVKQVASISLCPHCFCMTYTTPKGRCGKCKRKKYY